jgi:two-component system LytT family sensor kinase
MTLFTYARLTVGHHHDWALWPRVVARDLMTWAFWAALAPLILRLARRFPLVGPDWWRTLSGHILVGRPLTTAFNGLRFVENISFGLTTQTAVVPFIESALERTIFQFFIYLSVLAVGSAVDHLRREIEKDQRAARLESNLLAAKLSALRAQLQPHFLFNTLHTVALLIRQRDTSEALRVVLDLSELLRRVIDDTHTEQIPLRQELAFLRRYIGIESVRFDDVDFTIDADAETLDACRPCCCNRWSRTRCDTG